VTTSSVSVSACTTSQPSSAVGEEYRRRCRDAQLRHHHRLGASRRHVRVARQDLRVRSTLFGVPHRNTRPSPPQRPCGHVHVVDPRPKAMSSSLAKAAELVTVPEAGRVRWSSWRAARAGSSTSCCGRQRGCTRRRTRRIAGSTSRGKRWCNDYLSHCLYAIYASTIPRKMKHCHFGTLERVNGRRRWWAPPAPPGAPMCAPHRHPDSTSWSTIGVMRCCLHFKTCKEQCTYWCSMLLFYIIEN
jgi:hypothetical protein